MLLLDVEAVLVVVVLVLAVLMVVVLVLAVLVVDELVLAVFGVAGTIIIKCSYSVTKKIRAEAG